MTLKELLTIDTSNAAAWADRDKQVEATEKRLNKERKQAAFEKIVPERYWGASLDNYNAYNSILSEALAAVRQFVDAVKNGSGSSLVLLGPAGTGKTHLACAALRETGGAFFNAAEIIDELQRAKSFTSKESEAERLKRYANYNLVVIDEIGRGEKSADERYTLYQIINARYNARRPSLLISNYGRDGFLNFIGAAAQDRIIENGKIVAIPDSVQSYRAIIRANRGGKNYGL